MQRPRIPKLFLVLVAAFIVVPAWLLPQPALTIPVFAHQYGVTCQKCHSVIPHLNEFGAAFLAHGERIPGVQPKAVVPLAVKVNLAASSDYQGTGPNGAGLPKAILDEVEVFFAGAIGSRGSFLAEQYVVDGGEHGSIRDAWVNERLNPWQARIPLYAQAGSFTLTLPVDPETFRDSYQHYTLYDQTVGGNPFNFFEPKIGGRVSVGDPLRGLNLQVFAGPGHDRQSGLPSSGTDLMGFAQDTMGLFDPVVYRYSGTRPSVSGPLDQFERTGYGLLYNQWGKFSSESVLQTGWDSNCSLGADVGCASSGGFTQLRYIVNRRLFVQARYEGTSDSSGIFTRDGLALLGYSPRENVRLTIEDVIQHTPQTRHVFNLQATVAY